MKKPANENTESYFPDPIYEIKGFAIFMMDPDGIITSWNKGCELMKGYTSAEIIGQHYQFLFPDFLRDTKAPQRELDEAHANGRYEIEGFRRRKNGDLFWAHVVLTKVFNKKGDFIGYAKITQDQSEKKKIADELNKRNEDLKNINIELQRTQSALEITNAEVLIKKNAELIITNHDLDNFIYTASHDLKGPVSNLEGLLNAFVTDKKFNADDQPLVDMMFSSIERFKTTIKDLTEIGMVQRVNQTDINVLNFTEILSEVKSDIKELILFFNASIETNFDVAEINYSRKNLKSIIYNLLSNALKYSSPDRKLKIKISTERGKNSIILKVSDNGLGLNKRHHKKVFGMFKRLHQHVEGSGIGLYMIKRMIENAGGKIEFESEQGKGTTFCVYFKL